MLKGIPPFVSGSLLKALDELGHGDEIVIADRNFPAYSQGPPVERVAVADVTILIDALLNLVPLDDHCEHPFERMGPQDGSLEPNDRQQAVLAVARRVEEKPQLGLHVIPRLHFYERAKRAQLIISTLESAPYCDFILTKGVL